MKSITLILTALVLLLQSCTKKAETNDVLSADKNFSFPSSFPKDPGDEGKKTLAGIDSDKDGLRDDLQRWIYARFPEQNSTDEKKRKALRQMALYLQIGATENLKPDQLDKDIYDLDLAINCLHFVFGSDQGYIEREYAQAKTLNTKARIEMDLKNDKKFEFKSFATKVPDGVQSCAP